MTHVNDLGPPGNTDNLSPCSGKHIMVVPARICYYLRGAREDDPALFLIPSLGTIAAVVSALFPVEQESGRELE